MANHLDYARLLEGETLALIGGHDEIDWVEVEKVDLVARINGHWWRQRGRVELLYDSCAHDNIRKMYQDDRFWGQVKFAHLNITHTFFSGQGGEYYENRARFVEHGVDWDFYVHAPRRLFDEMDQLKTVPERHKWYINFIEEWNIYPFTGVLALCHLLLQPIKSIYIDGMDLFHEVDLLKEPKNRWHGNHYMPPQLNYLRSLRNDSRVVFSKILQQSIDRDDR